MSEIYRSCTLGQTLQETLDELLNKGEIMPEMAHKVMLQYDKSVKEALQHKAKSSMAFKAGKLHSYNLCDDVWSLELKDVELREGPEVIKVDKLKIVATKEDKK